MLQDQVLWSSRVQTRDRLQQTTRGIIYHSRSRHPMERWLAVSKVWTCVHERTTEHACKTNDWISKTNQKRLKIHRRSLWKHAIWSCREGSPTSRHTPLVYILNFRCVSFLDNWNWNFVRVVLSAWRIRLYLTTVKPKNSDCSKPSNITHILLDINCFRRPRACLFRSIIYPNYIIWRK